MEKKVISLAQDIEGMSRDLNAHAAARRLDKGLETFLALTIDLVLTIGPALLLYLLG